MKFRNPASRYALVGVFVAKTAGGVRVAVTGAGASGVFRVAGVRERRSAANFSAAALDGLKVDAERSGERHARRRRLSRPSHRRDGQARGRGGAAESRAAVA